MKKLLVIIVSLAVLLSIAGVAFADTYVNGYYRRDGTYVQPHWRSAPDGNPYNNFSFPGNTNPYTGQVAPGNPDTYLQRQYQRQHPDPSSYPWNPYGR